MYTEKVQRFESNYKQIQFRLDSKIFHFSHRLHDVSPAPHFSPTSHQLSCKVQFFHGALGKCSLIYHLFYILCSFHWKIVKFSLLDLLLSLLCEYSLWIRWHNKNLFMHSPSSQCVVDANTFPFFDRNFSCYCVRNDFSDANDACRKQC